MTKAIRTGVSTGISITVSVVESKTELVRAYHIEKRHSYKQGPNEATTLQKRQKFKNIPSQESNYLKLVNPGTLGQCRCVFCWNEF